MSALVIVIVLLLILFFVYMIYMPGRTFKGELPGLDSAGQRMADRLAQHVTKLCENSAGRNFIEKKGLEAAKNYIAGQFRASGYQVAFQKYQINGDEFANIEVELLGNSRPEEVIIVGAHYDAVIGAPGANDNGSGVAALLELADRLKGKRFAGTLRFVAFVNEEPPNSYSEAMGSLHYARRSKANIENIVAMFSLETIGYFRDESGSQHYPAMLNLFYPDKGNFIAFVGNLRSRPLVSKVIRIFRAHASFPSEGVAAPAFIPGIGWSDHWSFWKQGYQAVMVTDTALFRYPHYHTAEDTPDKINYEKMVYVVKGLQKVIKELLETSA